VDVIIKYVRSESRDACFEGRIGGTAEKVMVGLILYLAAWASPESMQLSSSINSELVI
jgi:hypothetical protein